MSYLWAPGPPTTVGWYAVTWGCDSGLFVDADYWDGASWEGEGRWHGRSPDAFPTEDEARIWAWMNHPEGEMSEADARSLVDRPPAQETFLVLGPEFNILKGGTFTVKIN